MSWLPTASSRLTHARNVQGRRFKHSDAIIPALVAVLLFLMVMLHPPQRSMRRPSTASSVMTTVTRDPMATPDGRWKLLRQTLHIDFHNLDSVLEEPSIMHASGPPLAIGKARPHLASRIDLRRRSSGSSSSSGTGSESDQSQLPLYLTPDSMENGGQGRSVATSIKDLAASFRTAALADKDDDQRPGEKQSKKGRRPRS